jgi:biotin operon repressor
MPRKKAIPPAAPKPAPPPNKADLLSASDSILSRDQIAEMLGISILSKEQVAEMLGVSTATLLRWHHLRQGPVRVKCGRQIYYRRESMDEYFKLATLMGERSR